MCFGDFALDHMNTLSEVRGSFRNNPNRMTLLEQRQPELTGNGTNIPLRTRHPMSASFHHIRRLGLQTKPVRRLHHSSR